MLTVHTITFYIHVLFGSAALILFWIPMASKKGSLDHKKFGRYYHFTMMTVVMTGFITSGLVLFDPYSIYGHRISVSDYPSFNYARFAVFYGFLFYLSLLVYISLHHGRGALKHGHDRSALRTPWTYFINSALALGSVPLFICGWIFEITLAMVFPFLGLAIAFSNLHYLLQKRCDKKAWLHHHLSSYIGTGIGAYTAFFAFGGRTLISDFGQWQLLFWLLPGVIGSFVIRHFSRKYAPKRPIRKEISHAIS